MDDLLIVRASERTRPRRHQRRATHAPMGASIGIVIGASFGFLGMSIYPNNPPIGLAAGIVVGIAIGGAIGPLLRPKSKRIPRFVDKHYAGFPFPEEESDETEKRSS